VCNQVAQSNLLPTLRASFASSVAFGQAQRLFGDMQLMIARSRCGTG
jgi:hypothetical protein